MNKILVLIFIIFSAIGCSKQNKQSEIILVNPEEMQSLLENEEVQLVDVRTVKEFNEHYIKDAENIVFDEDFENKLGNLDKNKPIVVYCRKGGRSAKCAKIMQDKGFTKIYDLEGGITQWMKEGNRVE